jgi:hypothetical protein
MTPSAIFCFDITSQSASVTSLCWISSTSEWVSISPKMAELRGFELMAVEFVHAQPSNDSCPFTPLPKTPSTSSAISPPAARSASSEKKRYRRGEPPPGVSQNWDFQIVSGQIQFS